MLDDGKLIFEIVSTDKKTEVVAKVIQGGELKSKKGVNLPNTKISLPALTEKDIADAIFAIEQKVDWIAPVSYTHLTLPTIRLTCRYRG